MRRYIFDGKNRRVPGKKSYIDIDAWMEYIIVKRMVFATVRSKAMTMEEPYQSFANSYDRYIGPITRGIRKAALEMIQPVAGMRILEVGCGTGLNLQQLQRAGNGVHGIDLSLPMVIEAHRKLDRTAVLSVSDAAQLPYPDRVFDLVIAMLTLHEMNDTMRSGVIKEIIRVCRTSGRLLLVDFHPGPRRFIRGWLVRGIVLFFEYSAGAEHFDNHNRFLAAGGLTGLIRSYPVAVERQKIIGGGNVALFVLKINAEPVE
ncbi:methyltransferase domain-containing protein [candidate division KSB1 bacterium]|nr:methyltransferase domain-containing protein [candidate division KSB1 bacterium]